MNLRTLATLADENITTLRCKFGHPNAKEPQHLYTFKCPRTLALSLAVGDHVVVEAASKITVVEVVEVHAEAELDLDDDEIEYRWAFQRVDMLHLTNLKKAEDVNVKALVASRRRAARQRALELLRSAVAGVTLTLDGRAV